MNRYTPQQMQFVLYSIHQPVNSNGAGFWSNTEGWVEFKGATRFTASSVPSCNMPISDGLDAKWIMWEPHHPTAYSSTAQRQMPACQPLHAHG